jgi:hypothetical protein
MVLAAEKKILSTENNVRMNRDESGHAFSGRGNDCTQTFCTLEESEPGILGRK